MKNVFQFWIENNKETPFKVRRFSWHPTTYFLVKRIEVTPHNWEYYDKTGNIYGKAYGDMYLRGNLTEKDLELSGAGSYQWHLIK
jgi:hypothetical protein